MIKRKLALLVPLVCVSLSVGCSSDSDGDGDDSGGAGGSSGTLGGTTNGGGGSTNGGTGGTSGSGGSDACTALAPTNMLPTGTPPKLILSEIVPGTGIEVFNPGSTPVDISSIWFCSNFDYKQSTAPSGKTAVAPGSYVVLAWPAEYDATASGGEMLVYLDSTFGPTADTVQNYVCWGNHTGGRKDDDSVAVDMLYTGDCTPALSAGALSRKPSTDGMTLSSYDVSAAPSLADCSP